MARLSGQRVRSALRARSALQARAAQRDQELEQLTARVATLEDEVRECRRQQLRVAELTDVVQELLLPLSQRDQDKVDELLQRYAAQLG